MELVHWIRLGLVAGMGVEIGQEVMAAHGLPAGTLGQLVLLGSAFVVHEVGEVGRAGWRAVRRWWRRVRR